MFNADGRRVVAALSKGPWDELLQLAGDRLFVALAQGAAGAPDLARQCAEQLRERTWEGDDDLAEQLEAALGDRPAPMLRPLPVDLEELAGILEGDPAHGGGRFDLRTGGVWPQAAIDYAREQGEQDPDDENPDRWLAVWCEGSRDAYRAKKSVKSKIVCKFIPLNVHLVKLWILDGAHSFALGKCRGVLGGVVEM